jgi:hypothetical protein
MNSKAIAAQLCKPFSWRKSAKGPTPSLGNAHLASLNEKTVAIFPQSNFIMTTTLAAVIILKNFR